MYSVVTFQQVSCILLSAGNSERMGSHKALLRFDKDLTFLEKIINTYLEAGIEQVIVVISANLADLLKERKFDFLPGVEFVINANPEWGRFYSLQKGLGQMKPGHFCFFQNIDNPFITYDLLQLMISRKGIADVIIPVFQERSGHPVLFNQVVAQSILSPNSTELKINEFLKQFSSERMEVSDPAILININSKEDYHKSGLKI